MKKSLDGSWYIDDQLNFDKRLIAYRYRTIKGFLKTPVGLELGPADGEMTKYLVKDFERLVCVDGSQELLDLIPNYPNIEKKHFFFEDFQTDEKFDTIILEHILEHVDDPVVLLKKVQGWVKPGGVILAGVPNGNSIHRQVAVKMKLLDEVCQLNERDFALGHKRVYTFESFKKDICSAGLNLIEMGGVYFKPLSNKQMEDNWNEEMIEGFYELGKDYPELCAEIYAVCKNK